MTGQGLVLAIATGGAVLAVWLDCRQATRMPQTKRRVFMHTLMALGTTSLVPLLMKTMGTQASPARAMLALFALVLPMFIYNFLSWIWMLRLLQSFRS